MRTIPNKWDPSFSGIRENMGKLLAKSLLTSAATSYFLNTGHSLAKMADRHDNCVLPAENTGQTPFQPLAICLGSRRNRAALMAA
jgi:hypothetical protein